MQRPIFIGDRLTAAGFGLAGAQVQVPPQGEELRTFQQALEQTELIMITAEYAAKLPGELVSQTLAAGDPLLLILPDVNDRVEPPDLGQRMRKQFGVAE